MSRAYACGKEGLEAGCCVADFISFCGYWHQDNNFVKKLCSFLYLYNFSWKKFKINNHLWQSRANRKLPNQECPQNTRAGPGLARWESPWLHVESPRFQSQHHKSNEQNPLVRYLLKWGYWRCQAWSRDACHPLQSCIPRTTLLHLQFYSHSVSYSVNNHVKILKGELQKWIFNF